MKEVRAQYSMERCLHLGAPDLPQVRAACNNYYIVVRRVKWLAWEKFLEGEEGKSYQSSINKYWIVLRYTKTVAQSTSTTPSLKLRDK